MFSVELECSGYSVQCTEYSLCQNTKLPLSHHIWGSMRPPKSRLAVCGSPAYGKQCVGDNSQLETVWIKALICILFTSNQEN